MKALHISAVVLAALVLCSCGGRKGESREVWLASEGAGVPVFGIDRKGGLTPLDTLPRGMRLEVSPEGRTKFEGRAYLPVKYGKKGAYVAEGSLTEDPASAVLEKTLYVRTTASIIDDTLASHVGGLARKGSELAVLGFDRLLPDGTVNRYHVQCGRAKGWLYGRYTAATKEEASRRYDRFDEAHAKVKNSFRGGEALGCEFEPYPKLTDPARKMPDPCYAFYLPISPGNLRRIDDYIALADSTRVNAFIIDIKDNECPGYKAEAMAKHSPTNYARANARQDKLYEEVVRKLHEHGYWVAGRITCFKDTYFAKDHPGASISDKATGEPFLHNKSFWPSAYSRDVWQFNVELAKESVRKFGLDEINFDYVRFPDKMISIDTLVNYHNAYGESKVQAIQNFVRYACDELHPLGVYVSIDVFGESANPGYTTAYGQYWPAISNIADAICAMPYPDHFADHYYGISKPWNHPYDILKAWGARVQGRQAVTPSPAIVRTWIQAYHIMKHVDRNGIDNDASFIWKQVRGLFDAGLTGGYSTWLSSGNISVYRSQKEAYAVDFTQAADSLKTARNE